MADAEVTLILLLVKCVLHAHLRTLTTAPGKSGSHMVNRALDGT